MTQVWRSPAVYFASLGGLALSLVFIFSAVRSPAEPNPKPDSEAVKKRVFRVWHEVYEIKAGVKNDKPSDRLSYEFRPNGLAYWLRFGELSPIPLGKEIRIDCATYPMQIDFVYDDGHITKTIFKFDEKRMTWVLPGKAPFNRPTDFTSSEENGYLLRVLESDECLDRVGTVKKKKP